MGGRGKIPSHHNAQCGRIKATRPYAFDSVLTKCCTQLFNYLFVCYFMMQLHQYIMHEVWHAYRNTYTPTPTPTLFHLILPI